MLHSKAVRMFDKNWIDYFTIAVGLGLCISAMGCYAINVNPEISNIIVMYFCPASIILGIGIIVSNHANGDILSGIGSGIGITCGLCYIDPLLSISCGLTLACGLILRYFIGIELYNVYQT